MRVYISVFVLVGLIYMLTVAGCKKYEEGPGFSYLTKEDRVTNSWNWAFFEKNNENLTGVYADSTITFTEDNVVKICGGETSCREGTWRLISKNEKLQLIFGTHATAYTIRMLKKDEMWLSFSSSDSSQSEDWQLVTE